MKLSNLVYKKKKRNLRIVINESQLSRLVENLNISSEHKSNSLIPRKKYEKY